MRENITLALQAQRGILRRIRPSRQRELAASWVEALDIRPADLDQPAGTLSGGNQQKVLLARLLALSPRVLVLDEPTRGIDVGAKVEIQNLVGELADNGLSVVFISAELEEVLRVGHRVAILRGGRVVDTLPVGGPHRRVAHGDGRAPGRVSDDSDGPSRRTRVVSDGEGLAARGEHLRRRAARGRLAPDGLARAQRPAERAAGHARARRAGDRAAALQPLARRARARHAPHPHDRARRRRACSDYGPTSIAMHFNFAARAARYNVETVSSLDADAGRRPRRGRGAAAAARRRDRARSSSTSAVLEAVRGLDLSIPVVAAASTARRSPLIVSIDQYRGARSAVRHLAELGHQRILHVAGPSRAPDATRARARVARRARRAPARGDRAARTATGRRRAATASAPNSTSSRARRSSSRNDHMSIGLLSALRERGLRVPEDVSVVGFDDVPEAGYLFPPLTTVRQDFAALGELIMQKVLDRGRRARHAPPRTPRCRPT